MISASPSLVFLHKVHNISIEEQISILYENRTQTTSVRNLNWDPKSLCLHWFSTLTSKKENWKLATYEVLSRDALVLITMHTMLNC